MTQDLASDGESMLSLSSFAIPNSSASQVILHQGKKLTRVEADLSKRTTSSSFVWRHGACYQADSDQRYWRCQICRQIVALHKGSTSPAIRHLKDSHSINRPSSTLPLDQQSEERSDNASVSTSTAPDHRSLFFHINRSVFRALLLRFVVTSHQSFTVTENDAFRALIEYISPSLRDHVPSARTLQRDLLAAYEKAQLEMQELFTTAKSRIHITFDIWTSPNGHAFLGVIAHWLGSEGQLQFTTLAIRQLEGSHTGENVAVELASIIRFFGIQDRLGVIVSDNVTVNDTTTSILVRILYPEDPQPRRRGRCVAHIINLAAKAFIQGKDVDALAQTVPESSPEYLLSVQETWRRKGPIGKLHNLVVHIRGSPQRRERFLNTATSDDSGDHLMVILDNSTRWNSTYLSIARALKLRRRIGIYCLDDQDVPDRLSETDWDHLQEIHDALKPFYDATKEVEGDGSSVHQVLPILDFLLTSMEEGLRGLGIVPGSKKRKQDLPLLAVSYQNAWQKLTDYYRRTDDDWLIYAASNLYHPAYRKRYFDIRWEGQDRDVKESMIKEVWAEWKNSYKTLAPMQPMIQQVSKQTSIQQWVSQSLLHYDDEVNGSGNDEFLRYISSPLTHFEPPATAQTLASWWIKDLEYPLLKQHAIDVLTVPATTAGVERLFSQAKRYITDDRNRLGGETLEATLLLKNWWQQGHISPPRD